MIIVWIFLGLCALALAMVTISSREFARCPKCGSHATYREIRTSGDYWHCCNCDHEWWVS